MVKVSTLLVVIAVLLQECVAWLPRKKQPQGGQHLINAGNALKAAAEVLDGSTLNYSRNYYHAYPQLLREAGESLSLAGEAWTADNWEAVTYAADDCSFHFQALSQVQQEAAMQRVYKGASGELSAVAGIRESIGDDGTNGANPNNAAAPNLAALSQFLIEAAVISEKLNKDSNGSDTVAFLKSLRAAAKSIDALAKEED